MEEIGAAVVLAVGNKKRIYKILVVQYGLPYHIPQS
jgi:hypothetical protein